MRMPAYLARLMRRFKHSIGKALGHVIAAATETSRGERAHAVGAHVAEGHKPALKFIGRDVIFPWACRCPIGQPQEAPSPASPTLGR